MNERNLTAAQSAELRKLAKKHKILAPQAVVDFAWSPKTALHSRFTWDDSEAAVQYRLEEARRAIRWLHYTPSKAKVEVREMVSLPDDRNPDGGYRYLPDVLSDAELRADMLQEALRELNTFRRKYHGLTELTKVFEAADVVVRKAKRKKSAP